MTTNPRLAPPRSEVATIVKRMLIAESRLTMEPTELRDDEPLTGPVLNVSSFGFVGMFIRLEDELGVELPDDLFIDRVFTTVNDIVNVVSEAAGRAQDETE
ncbi:acyl carrier protein (plasmid) [Streptomyces sp. BHT-5-2]|uniref:acyl carrier protein n=1 Tax=Streptomyces sp. BHT-5-2 TaxID=2866715 RepID=UPI001C8D6453|nr:acyl carrier protein [Streptomyces sp. BHT-5-2]QZL04209.1 acyl carrier protein [Streptomyces sp. BHT-5-2]QZL08173.1 acyl carrier protein [Streptomyces sp. BHT-5-2]